MEKKNTVLLTVIAIATLLVAVVGATFAYFSASVTNTEKTTVTATTAKANDVFTYTANNELVLDAITNENMSLAQKGQFVDSDVKTTTVSLQAGDGEATCTYDLVWTETSAEKYALSTKVKEANADALEFTLKGTDDSETPQTFAETNVDKLPATLGSYTITDNGADSTATTQTWTFTAQFYNLEQEQNDQINKTFTGEISVANVRCENGGQLTYTAE
ncbi:MAG: hypothetical protein IJO27_01200 [Bacilli bacterium]|nr:hypothetical protein [Bacilli bacterium]